MNIESVLEGAGVPVTIGINLIDRLGLDASQFRDSRRYERFKDILYYLKDKEPSTVSWVISQGTRRQGDMLENMFHYIGILKGKEQAIQKQESLKKTIDEMVKTNNPEIMKVQHEFTQNEKHLEMINEDINQFTK
jgi:hypothetical protein